MRFHCVLDCKIFNGNATGALMKFNRSIPVTLLCCTFCLSKRKLNGKASIFTRAISLMKTTFVGKSRVGATIKTEISTFFC